MAELYHAFIDFAGGMQRGIDPVLHSSNQYWLAVNASLRGGILSTRNGLESTGVTIPAGTYQGGFFYRSEDGNLMVFVISGEVWVYDLAGSAWSTLGVLLDTAGSKVHFCQANRFLIIQDNVFPATWAAKNWPVILDGASLYDQSALRASDPDQCTPKGGPMAYGHGRLFVASPYVFSGTTPTGNLGMRGWVAGDIVKAYAPEELLVFSENIYLDEGGQIVLPAEMGEIRAMTFQQNVQNGVGQGPLIVGAENGFCVYAVNAPRAEWNDIDLGQVAYLGVGTYSARSIARLNSDVFFRDSNGNLRTFIETAATRQGGVMNVNNLSSSVYDLVSGSTNDLLEKCSSSIASNRHFTTMLPDATGTFSGIISLDMLPISAMNMQVNPMWESVWTGHDFLEIMTGIWNDKESMLVVAEDSSARTIYVPAAESAASDEDSQLECWMVTSHTHCQNPFRYKQFKYAVVWISELASNAELTIYYRADRSSLWAKCSTSVLKQSGKSQNRRPLRFTPVEPVPVQLPQNVPMTHGFIHQFAVGWTGRLRIERIRFMFEDKIEDFDVAKTETAPVDFVAGNGLYDLDFYSYRRTT